MTILILDGYFNMRDGRFSLSTHAYPMHGAPINLLTTPTPPKGWQFTSMVYHAFKIK